ncbi:MAG: Stk1 family PASTA domain-containing Ser/Thr kinase [Acidimicrobiia bacterium]
MEERVLADRYRVVKHLARGGMADVYEAEDTLLNRSVAVKILHANFASDEAFVARFRREAQAAANLSHPNIVAIYDWGKDAGTYFMVMELIRGRTLREILKTEGAILPRRAAEISAEAAAALSIAHQHGVYHRDIKPGNIMITAEGAVKVTDFGIARALDDSEELTRTGAVIGTATYFSPEQAQGLPADDRSDVYALGIVLYEMLAGKPPFTGESPVAVAYQHVSEPAVSPDEVNPEAPRELAAIAEHAIQKDPAARYQTAEEFRADLVRYLTGSEPHAAAAVMAAAATSVIASPSGVAPPPPVAPATQTFDAPAEDRSSASYWVAVGALIVVLLVGLFLLFQLLSGGDEATSTVEIPDLTGLPAQDAFEELQNLDLKVRAIEETSDEVAAGLVIRTDPPAGEEVEVQSFVDVVVSLGAEQFGVPNVINENVDVARALITAQGFTVGAVEYQLTEDVDKNIVIAQNPEGGTNAAPGTPVNMIVSGGPDSIEIPDVSGKAEQSAVLELTRAGFESVVTQEEYSPDVLAGFVIETNPAAGQSVPPDATIVVLVSIGPEPVEVPDLTGDSTGQAEQALNALGLLMAVSGETVEVPVSSGLIGNVADQSPAPGNIAEVGSTVTVRLGVAQQVVVPDLAGMTTAEAQAAATAVGLNVDITGTTITNDQNLDGTVASQDPAAGTSVDEGSFINIVVYTYQPDVPDFTGLTVAEAQALATSVGLGTVTEVGTTETPDAALVGTIESQDPLAGTSVPTGTAVDVIVFVAAP